MTITLDQLMIIILGISSIACISTTKPHIMKYGFLFGMLAEPFWMYTSCLHKQWGILFVSIIYTLCHLKGYIITNKESKK